MLQSGTAVEKLLRPRFQKIKLLYNAPQMTFLFSRHFVSPNFWLFERKLEFFNRHRQLHSLTRLRSMSAMGLIANRDGARPCTAANASGHSASRLFSS